MDRKQVQDFFIRVCEDSSFCIDAFQASMLTARAFNSHPLIVWTMFPSVDDMLSIAAGTHAVLKRGQR